jgi:1,4-dihydroxy-2-naphthoyl-CoA hydrolase
MWPMTDDAATLDDFLSQMSDHMGALNERMGVQLTEVSKDRVVGTMPVEGNTQPYGLLHGGASVVLAESLGSLGSQLHAWPDRFAVGVDINATHHRSATAGTVTGVATPLHVGRKMATWDVVISDEEGRRLCTSRITCALLPTQRD